MMLLSVLFSAISTIMMSYVTMNVQLGPWIAPIFVVVCMVIVIPLVKAQWFYEHAIMAIVAGSLGGMIGICLGLSFPSFYFLHKALFEYWLSMPLMFCSALFLLIICASMYALFLSYFLRYYFLNKPGYVYPMSQLVYDVIFVDVKKRSHDLMISGVVIAGIWNFFMGAGRICLMMGFAMQVHMIPLLMSVGFVAGSAIALPIFAGSCIRFLLMQIMHVFLQSTVTEHSCLITFCLGMLIAAFAKFIYAEFNLKNRKDMRLRNMYMVQQFKKSKIWILYAGIIGMIFVSLTWFHTSWMSIVYGIFMIAWLSKYLVQVLAKFGVIEVDSYVWLVLLPMIYFLHPTSLSVVIIAIFATLVLGIVVDAMFSYKVIDLAKISYQKALRYQIVASICSGLTAAIFFWIYGKHWMDHAAIVLAPKAHELDAIIRLGHYDYRILIFGILMGLIILAVTSELIVIIGAMLMSSFMALILIIAGGLSYWVIDRKKWYPFWFGIYAGQILCLMVETLRI